MNGTIILHRLTNFVSASSSALKRIAHPLWRLLTFSLADDMIYRAKTLSASLAKGTLSVAYGTRLLSRMKIRGTREYPLEEGKYPQPEVFASSLALAINDLGATKADVCLSIPKAWAVIKTMEFPAAVKENLSNVVAYELDRITPFTAEEAFYDFRVLDEKDGKLTLMVVAAKIDVVRPYIDALKERGIAVSRLTVNLSAIETLCRSLDEKTDKVFVEIKREGFEGALFLNGAIAGTSAGAFPSEDEREKVDLLLGEIAPLIDILKNQGKSAEVVIHLHEPNPAFKELLKIQVTQPVRFLNETDIRIAISDSEKSVPYTAIGGVLESLWPRANGLNLLSKGYHEKFKAPMVLTILLLLVILGMWILYLIAPLRIEGNRLEEIDRQIASRKGEVKKIEALKKELESLNTEISDINNFKGNRRMALDILRELTTVLPKNAWLSRVRITGTTVELEGYASSATGLLPKLEASLHFGKAEFASPTFRDARMNADRFNIKMEIEGIEKEEIEKKGETGADEEE
jgi:general secretion pathway protein L